jgi:hypothetical protein
MKRPNCSKIARVAIVGALGAATILMTPGAASAACRSGFMSGEIHNRSAHENARIWDEGKDCGGNEFYLLGPGVRSKTDNLIKDTDNYHWYSDAYKNHNGSRVAAYSWTKLSYHDVRCDDYDRQEEGLWLVVDC